MCVRVCASVPRDRNWIRQDMEPPSRAHSLSVDEHSLWVGGVGGRMEESQRNTMANGQAEAENAKSDSRRRRRSKLLKGRELCLTMF